jgi:hypothetical protein
VIVRTPPVAVPYPAVPLFLTVTARSVPVGAVAETVIVAVTVVELTTFTLENVTPEGPVSFAPVAKPDPVIVAGTTAPCATDDGVICVSVGAATTVRHDVQLAAPRSGLVSFTVTEPSALPSGALNVTVIVVEDFTFRPLVLIPLGENDNFAPVWKPVPESV